MDKTHWITLAGHKISVHNGIYTLPAMHRMEGGLMSVGRISIERCDTSEGISGWRYADRGDSIIPIQTDELRGWGKMDGVAFALDNKTLVPKALWDALADHVDA